MILMVDFVKEENHTERIQVLHGVYFMRGRENNSVVRYINDAHQVHGRVGQDSYLGMKTVKQLKLVLVILKCLE